MYPRFIFESAFLLSMLCSGCISEGRYASMNVETMKDLRPTLRGQQLISRMSTLRWGDLYEEVLAKTGMPDLDGPLGDGVARRERTVHYYLTEAEDPISPRQFVLIFDDKGRLVYLGSPVDEVHEIDSDPHSEVFHRSWTEKSVAK